MTFTRDLLRPFQLLSFWFDKAFVLASDATFAANGKIVRSHQASINAEGAVQGLASPISIVAVFASLAGRSSVIAAWSN